ncbi:hypothetical protein ABBQ38_015364 [Trebouxia sp. C0009 RCD-2024]
MAVTFDERDATLNTLLSDDLLTATPVVSGRLAHIWSGARCNSSAAEGKVFFVVNIVEQELEGDTSPVLPPEALIGVSFRATATAQLGSGSSWAYSSLGQKRTAAKAEPFGVPFAAGDSIGCFLDIDSDPCTMSFSHNGSWLGQAHNIPKPDQREGGLYPHVLLKGFGARIQFTQGTPWPKEAGIYTSWTAALQQGNVSAPLDTKVQTGADREVLVLVGLPGSGKSTWATRYVANHPEKRYAVLSVDGVIKQLKGGSQIRGKQKPPDAKTQKLAEQAYEELLDHIETVPRNYVLDDSNVYEDVRSARVSKFRRAGFKTRAAVIVLPDSSLFRRQRKQHQEEGKSVPETVIADMRANFSMPEVGEVFQEVFFVEAKPPEAHEIAAAQADAAKAALPMLKARVIGGRQTRSRTAKATPKRASAPAKTTEEEETPADASVPKRATAPAVISEEKKTQADGVELPNGTAAEIPPPSDTTSTMSQKLADSTLKSDSAATPVSATKAPATDSIMTTTEPAPAAEGHTSVANPLGGQNSAAEDTGDAQEAAPQVAAADTDDGPVSPGGIRSNELAADSAGAPETVIQKAEPTSAEAAVEEVEEAAGEEGAEAASAEARKSGHSVLAAADAEVRKDAAEKAATAEAGRVQKAEEDSKPAQTQSAEAAAHNDPAAQDMEPAAAATPSAPTQAAERTEDREEQAEVMEEDKPEPVQQPVPKDAGPQQSDKPKATQAEAATATQAETQIATTEPTVKEKPEAAKEEDEPMASPMDGGVDDAGEKKEEGAAGDGRGVKRPSAPVVRVAKQARTNQAAGRLVGNIRSQGTVKRTVIRGRVGARPAGMRLPPPMSSEAVPNSTATAAAAGATNTAGGEHDKTEAKSAKGENKGAFKDVMQQLLPAEQAPKPASTPHKGSPGGGKQEQGAQRASSTAKASTPKRQDQVTTKPAGGPRSTGPKSGDRDKDKDRMERDRSHSARRDPPRAQPAPRHGGRNLPPPIGGSRQSTAQGANRHQGRDRPAPRVAALGPRDAGIQKVRGRAPPPYDRAPRYGPSRAMPPVMSRGQTRNGPQAGHTPGREFDEGPHRAGPSWDRNPAPLRPGPVPARLPPPMGRRAPLPERGPPLARAPRDDFGGSQRMVNPRAPIRGAGPDRDVPGPGFPVGRRAGPPGARQPGAGPAHTAPRTAPPRGRVPPPAARRDSHPPLVAQRAYEPPAAPFPTERQPARYDEQPRFSGAAPDQRGPRAPHSSGGMGHRPNPAGSRAAGGRGPPPQVLSPPGPSRQQPQHPPSYRSPGAPVTLPPPRLRPVPGGPVPGLGGGEYTPRGRRDQPASQADRPRSRSRGPPYSDRPAPRGVRQPAAQQLRSAVYPHEQPIPAPYHAPDGPPIQAHAPLQYEGPTAGGYPPEPQSARRGALDRPQPSSDRYGPSPAVRAPPQQWHNKPDPVLAAAPGPAYQQRPQGAPVRDSFGRQDYADQPRSDGVLPVDRRTDRRGRGSRERRQQQGPPPLEAPRYAPARATQAYPEQEYAPGLAPDAYLPRDAPPLSRSHTYHEEPRGGDPSYMPPQHAQSAPPRYDSPMPGYAPPLAQEPHQPVYGSGAAPMQGYTSTAPAPIERQPYYPPQQQPHQQGGPSQQQQQYADGSGYGREPAYSSAPCGYAAPQGGYMDNPPALTPRGGYSQTAPVSVPRHRSDEYDPGYSGRSQGYGAQGRPLSTAPVSHGGVSHDAGRPRAAPRGGSQAWAPSPREAAYVGAPHVSGMLWLSFPPIAPFSQHCCCIWRALSKE